MRLGGDTNFKGSDSSEPILSIPYNVVATLKSMRCIQDVKVRGFAL